MKRWLKRLIEGPITDAAIAVGHLVILALGFTWRVRHVGRAPVEESRRAGNGRVLYAFSHGVILPLSYTHRRRDIQVLISESRDGEIITRITANLGFGSVRGSSSRGGSRAVVRMASRAREGYDLAITPDGPRGPRGSVSPGAVLIAARGEVPLVPVAVATTRGFRARSWDRFLVPSPFARVWVVYGVPIRIDRTRSDAEIDTFIARIAKALEDTEAEATEYAAGRRAARDAVGVPA